MRLILAALLGLVPGLAFAAQNTLTWIDASTNETGFIIERTIAGNVAACQTATGWTQIVTTAGPDVATFTDTAVTEGTTYCYRVKAWNAAGPSSPSNVAGRSVPFTIPVAPTGLQVGP